MSSPAPKPNATQLPQQADDRPPLYQPNVLREHLKAMSRDPFKDLLAMVLEAHPSQEDWRDLARRYPEKWAQALSMVSHLGGYHDKLEIDHNIAVAISQMSDQQLYGELEQAGLMKVVDGEFVEVEQGETENG